MRRRLAENVLFFREYVRNFHSTGALLPSGRFLAAALARYVGQGSANGKGQAMPAQPQRILEVGPGTGAVTRQIIGRMGASDSLDMVELNETFVQQLRGRFASEPAFQAVASRARVLHCPVEELPHEQTYDVIVSGLPFNNFPAALVEQILAALYGLLSPGGTLSFFEYIAVRRARALFSGRADRERLRGIARALEAVLGPHEIRRDAVWLNVTPAWVHHVQREAGGKGQ
jgi:phosphatidylethanolamine/phosphatidyl-N-methylethanolamine N-methyltransferase